MREAEQFRVQTEAAEGIDGAAIERVADDRMFGFGKMRPNLILTAGLESDFQHRIVRRSRDRAVTGDGELRVGMRIDALHLEILALEQMRSNRSGRRFDRAFDDRDVKTIDGVGRELLLESFARMKVFCEHQHARGLTVE